jgi:hypothetical protein
MALTFRGPDRFLDPADIQEVVQLVRERGADYWNSNSGDASLVWSGPDGKRRLTLFFLGRSGFHLVYRGSDDRPVAAMPARAPARAKWVDIEVGGNPMRISSGQAVSRREAELILLHFAERGEPDPKHRWEPVRWPDVS